ncbi:excinuclease ABC subunit UvrA [uncultured Robinsoniella sp.]|uniref:excinuclease ABC subunit UvrA n=1 Tax=uncultured Robinsoniella sp. TaxID=904190 RepID=UPI00374EDF61
MDIRIKGARQNNLKNISVEIPKNKLIVFTGVSGSGKSTLAMETLQRECQRQYMESMGMMMEIGSRPIVDEIEGLSPAISINQKNTNRNPRSTVGTVTEISPYLRVLFSKIGERHCKHCGKLVTPNFGEDTGDIYAELPGQAEDEAEMYEQMVPCPHCQKSITELTASHFSFNKPLGACPVCKGIGVVSIPDIKLLIDKTKSIKEFAVHGWDQVYVDRYGASIANAARYYGFDFDLSKPVSQYSEPAMDLLLYGALSKQFTRHFPDRKPPKTVLEGRFEGVITNLMRRYEEKNSYSAKQRIEKFLIQQECQECGGIRFRKDILDVQVAGVNITKALSMPLTDLVAWLNQLDRELALDARAVVGQVLDNLIQRIEHIIEVGAGYLTLNQPSVSLSAGEAQRIKLASVLGSSLTGVLYVLDEPSTGLHSRDTAKVIDVLIRLRDMGNTVIVIEHDLAIIQAADYIIDFGPGAGRDGGKIVAAGKVADIINCPESVTGKYLSDRGFTGNYQKSDGNGRSLLIRHANTNNLKDLSIEIPLGKFITVTGVSGAGKSSLVFGVVAEAAEAYFHQSKRVNRGNISGFEHLDDVITISQVSIGRSPRSNAATYTDIFSDIRNLYAEITRKEHKGLQAKHFSYNVPGGRCENCQGAGKLSVSMNFLPDVEVVCPVCRGKRYQKPVLNVRYRGYHIAEVLELSIDEAAVLFNEENEIVKKLKVLQEVGLGYLVLGQSATTLSGGEAQRLKLAKELSKQPGGQILYLLDEPTCGLHPQDTKRLIGVFRRLVQRGGSVIVAEHNPEVIRSSDWVLDLGPEGGNYGGQIVVQGTPEEIKKHPASATGSILAQL